MEGVNNEPSPGQLDKKLSDTIEEQYTKMVQEEKDARDAEIQKAAVTDFLEKIKKLGFVPREDVEKTVTESVKAFQSQIDEIKKDFAELKEFSLRAKARGQNSGAQEPEEPQPAQDLLKAWESSRKAFAKDWKK